MKIEEGRGGEERGHEAARSLGLFSGEEKQEDDNQIQHFYNCLR